jgi:hypothetical protein
VEGDEIVWLSKVIAFGERPPVPKVQSSVCGDGVNFETFRCSNEGNGYGRRESLHNPSVTVPV